MEDTTANEVDETIDVPPTAPKKRLRKKRGSKAPAAAKPTAVVARGADLVPDFDSMPKGVHTGYWFWVGVLPGCPKGQIDVGGVDFPKMEEIVSKGPDGKTQRAPAFGGLRQLTREKIDAIREQLPRTVIRFYEGSREEPGTGTNMGHDYVRPRSGQLITIPSQKTIDEYRKIGKGIQPYHQHKNDEAAAAYMFAVLCDNQERPVRGTEYPDTLDITGIEYPEE